MDYYDKFSELYNQRTWSVDPTVFLEPLLSFLKPDAEIIDIGCGSGRDLFWLVKHGFKPTGFEKSEGLATLAEKQSGCRVIRGDFSVYDFSSLAFDGLLLIGALVHVPHEELFSILNSILKCLQPGGIVLLSQKMGTGCKIDEYGRTFYHWKRSQLNMVIDQIGLDLLQAVENESALGTSEKWLTCYLQLQRRQPIGNPESSYK